MDIALKLLSLSPNVPSVYYLIGQIMRENENYVDAVKTYQDGKIM
jgi:cytochrome c-type biogenesis protein CcmH/NrfG